MEQAPRKLDQELSDRFDRLLRQLGTEPDALSAKLTRQMIHTAVKLLRDGADTGELKLISRSLKELRYALKVFRDYRDAPKVAIFGSARTAEDHVDYLAAVELSRQMAQRGWMIITGAGDGIMRAGHGGAGRDSSFGVAIRLPFETTANEYIQGDPKLIVFRYFFTRKLIFVSQAHAVVLFPGGFGTQDECFETLTLIQTGKAPIVPVVMLNPPGSSYWQRWDRFVQGELLGNGLIDESDRHLYTICANVQEAAGHILAFYGNYHSQRFVRDELVIRMHRTLQPRQVDRLNEEFADLVATGRIEQGGPLAAEREHPALARLRFVFTRRHIGRLRLLIDRINALDRDNRA